MKDQQYPGLLFNFEGWGEECGGILGFLPVWRGGRSQGLGKLS
jgi:hypothetical protein